MAIRVALKHHTEYHFDRPVALSPHVIRLRPAPHCRTPILSYSLDIEPGDHFINWQQDPFGNYLARFVFPQKTRELKIHVELIAEMTVINPFDFFLEESAENFPLIYEDGLRRDLAPYLEIREQGPELRRWLDSVDRSPKQIVDFLVALNQRLSEGVRYLIRMEPGVQTCETTLGEGSGSCRDSAWLLVQILRHLGLAARFVSGYLVQLTADVKALDGPSGPVADFTDLHAWAEVFLPGAGWIGLDPTSGLLAGEGHIPLACTPEPSSAAPVTGATDVCETEFSFYNGVERIHEDPRVTKPYGESQWQAIDALGHSIDKLLKKQDTRLTMGGEPTFVSIDDMEGAEWNNAALGVEKRRLAGELLQRLKAKFAPDGMLHTGQGKWYPGEPLPRWALSLIWRHDGHPLWQDPKWLADDTGDYQADDRVAKKFIDVLCGQLGLDPALIVPGYEDSMHYLLKEGRLPENVDAIDNKLNNPLERERVRKIFQRGLDQPAGYALPLKYHSAKGYWKSSTWPFRSGLMFLLPGDSAMGYRLPLESLPWKLPESRDDEPELDPFAERGELPRRKAGRKGKSMPRSDDESEREVVHTALVIEARDGRLHVFMPPLAKVEYYAELLGYVEAVARKLHTPVLVEGYEPPRDPRLGLLQITPDPGVIEVNIHPAKSWGELVENTTTLYEFARLTRLGTEKFMLDGRHSGTGGGNHVTLGGASAADSPFLRRPHLLRSLVTFWQQHPALSYLFSGQFIGPTSQAPRVDEARDDNLYELEIAFGLLPNGESEKPWLVDRVLRNFLVDLTGNTHRAEFCIDKLYSPDSASGRLGLVELRAFEMPPHAQMSLVQMLLLRALVAHFWKHPYTGTLVRWGTELHDRFMLRHYVWEDIKQVIGFLRGAGFGFELEWFSAFREFRFPRIGTLNVHGMQLDLHAALEPWHVLGEESSGQGTSRYVDSSVERLQVSVHGMAGDRYIVTCNGRRVPLRASGVRGHYVAGVRYKAWEPYSALHPSIKRHTPLVFDVVDTANRRSIGGCTYHVSHPGGRNYDSFPVNANEAEARRNARFWDYGNTQGEMKIPPEEPHPEQPYTLDLRFAVEK
ncbi:MAG: transglutaminase family protein [Gammaproteobacteria bacterium]|nr:transglutaminase family protein [Gammaproteobacteria bacterium]